MTAFRPKWSEKRVANHLLGFYADLRTCFNNWGFYLFDPSFDGEPELRNKINAVWVCSLFDVIDGRKRILTDLERHATYYGNKFHLDCCKFVKEVCEAVEDVLSLYTKDEQIFLNDFRDQLVHSWRWRVHEDVISKVAWFESGEIKREKMSHADYHAIVRPFYEQGVDHALAQCRKVLPGTPPDFWKFVVKATDEFTQRLQEEIQDGISANL